MYNEKWYEDYDSESSTDQELPRHSWSPQQRERRSEREAREPAKVQRTDAPRSQNAGVLPKQYMSEVQQGTSRGATAQLIEGQSRQGRRYDDQQQELRRHRTGIFDEQGAQSSRGSSDDERVPSQRHQQVVPQSPWQGQRSRQVPTATHVTESHEAQAEQRRFQAERQRQRHRQQIQQGLLTPQDIVIRDSFIRRREQRSPGPSLTRQNNGLVDPEGRRPTTIQTPNLWQRHIPTPGRQAVEGGAGYYTREVYSSEPVDDVPPPVYEPQFAPIQPQGTIAGRPRIVDPHQGYRSEHRMEPVTARQGDDFRQRTNRRRYESTPLNEPVRVPRDISRGGISYRSSPESGKRATEMVPETARKQMRYRAPDPEEDYDHARAMGERAAAWDRSRWHADSSKVPDNEEAFDEMPGATFKGTPDRNDFHNYYVQTHGASAMQPTIRKALRYAEPTYTGPIPEDQYEAVDRRRTFSRTVKSTPFEANIKASDKLYRWSNWLSVFMKGLERAGVTSQRDRAVELSLAAGVEVNEIVLTEGLLPEPHEVRRGFPFFNYMLNGISAAFAKMTDPSVAASEFFNAQQREGEPANEYGMRVKLSALKLKLRHPTLISSIFIRGLADVELRRWANSFNMNFQRALETAIRSENDPVFRSSIAMGALALNAPIAVAAVEAAAIRGKDQERSGQGKKRPRGGHNQEEGPPPKRQSDGMNNGRCRRCGRKSHRDAPCPATNSQCNTCGKVGHFSAVCRDVKVREIRTSPQGKQEVKKNIFD
jgi:hypothetical protein